MRIALTADPELPVPPLKYGGIERVVSLLIRGLVEQGHQVTLFGNSASNVPCTLVPYAASRSGSWGDTARNATQIATVLTKSRYDLIHSFGRLAYLLPLMPIRIPKLMSYQRGVSPRSVAWGKRLAGDTLQFTACSRKMIQEVCKLGTWHVVYNGVSADQYEFCPRVEPDAPLVFLGRVEWIKGPHLAIEVAKRTGRRLIIAGNIPEQVAHQEYFRTQIRPQIDGSLIQYAGPVDDAEKNELLGRSAALLMPIVWEEPFGIVMAESLACGTPVIGLRRGAVPEVVRDGVTGFVCEDVEQMAAAVGRINEIDRGSCRRSMEEQFSARVMVSRYLRIYEDMLKASRRAA